VNYYGSSVTLTTVSGNFIMIDLPESQVLNPGETIIVKIYVTINDAGGDGYISNTVSVDYSDALYAAPARHPAVLAAADYPKAIPYVFPNPFKMSESVDKVIKFWNVPPGSVITIYTLSGEFVTALDTNEIRMEWDATNNWKQPVAPGIYFYTMRNLFSGQVFAGKIYIINSK
jgi:hypothetical protein